MRSKTVMPKNYVLLRVFDDFITASTSILRVSTDKNFIFSYARKLTKENKSNIFYYISVYNSATGEIMDRLMFVPDRGGKCALIHIGLSSSSK